MSRGQHNSAHGYFGRRRGRGARLAGKLGRAITLERLIALVDGKEDGIRIDDDPKPDDAPDDDKE